MLWALELDGDFYEWFQLCKLRERETKSLYLSHLDVFVKSSKAPFWKKNKIPIHLYTEQIES